MFPAAFTVATGGMWIVHLAAGSFLAMMLLLPAIWTLGVPVVMSISYAECQRSQPEKLTMRFM